ncbi:hypothetical protein DES40_1603 [Litorimonas taeanensis]|uniref:Uncharacterized protein n=1 Tax=Litorimonas taeanensis TaxID=568099 RepID=A0A420WCS5_9PROT|nr:hypothetical protein [Litorimonas taeanensis]RKQ68829.1 hypothetical protein DES40_1603 [Litorimonas taeanensis]
MNKQAILPTLFVFLLPFLCDVIIFGGSGQSDKVLQAPAILIGNAVFAAFPFLVIGAVMRPRRSVTLALWVTAFLTGLVWMSYAISGWGYQIEKNDGMANLGLSMFLMVWPFICVILMGVIAKFKEADIQGGSNV